MAESQTYICNVEGCTFSQTGQCVLDNDPTVCPDRLASLIESDIANDELRGEVILEAPEDFERFLSSYSLTVDDTEKLMRSQYCKIVGILGVPDTGKTASLASLYLLLSHGKLDGFRFLDSKSLRAFEEISRGARRWSPSNTPEQLTVHTESQNERIAGYLHLKLEHTDTKQKVDLLMTDLPGEWTTSLIDKNINERFNFLQSAERIWINVSAEDIALPATRQSTIHRLEILLGRLKDYLKDGLANISIVITHSDKGSVTKHLDDLKDSISGCDIKLFEVASFSENDAVPAGTGIKELISDLLQSRETELQIFELPLVKDPNTRQMLLFQNK